MVKNKITPIKRKVEQLESVKRKVEQLESGDTANVSGFYFSNHLACEAADIWIRRESQLPVCATCGESATFILRREIEHISEDPDFK